MMVSELDVEQAAAVLRAGGLVAFPTETVYGLGANALDPRAVARIFAAKERPLSDPLIVHVAGTPGDALERLTDQGIIRMPPDPADIRRLMTAFWPGALTLLLPRGLRIPLLVTAGRDSVAVRMPSHTIARRLIERAGVPVAAPSANRFGHVSPTTAQHVRDDLAGRVDMILDGGPTQIGVESAVLDALGEPPRILRHGGITREQIEAVLGRHVAEPSAAVHSPADSQAEAFLVGAESPGTLDAHYAPRATVRIARDGDDLRAMLEATERAGARAGVLLTEAQRSAFAHAPLQFVLGADMEAVARNLYAGLRALDSAGVDEILVSAIDPSGLGAAVADRLRRAAVPGARTTAPHPRP